MIFGHFIGWWDNSMAVNYEENGLLVSIIMILGLMVFPCFLFIYGFNQVNSFLKRRGDVSNRHKIRSRAIKRSIIFLIFLVFTMIIMAFSRGEPEKMLNYIFNWHLFHLFAFSTLFFLLMWELACWIEEKINGYWSSQQCLTIILLLNFILVITLFFLFHDYMIKQPVGFPVQSEIKRIIEYALLDISTSGVIPWLSFPLAGGITASFLDLNNIHKIRATEKSVIILSANLAFLAVGLLYLAEERFISHGIGYTSSFSHIFISIGLIGFVFMIIVLLLDINQKIPRKSAIRLFYPIIIVSKISLTVYLIHPVFGVLNPSLIPSKLVLMLLASLYSLFFVILAHFWQKWDFKYSFEWIIKEFS